MLKKLLVPLILGLIGVVVVFSKPIAAQEPVILHLFTAKGCPHCAAEKEFLTTLTQELPYLTVVEYEVTSSKANRDLLIKVGQKLEADISGVPFTVVGKTVVSGYLNDETTGERIKNLVIQSQASSDEDTVSQLKSQLVTPAPTPVVQEDSQKNDIPETVTLPLFGKVSVKSLSLPALTVAIAFFDGFNPCAMWVLIFLISMLLGMEDRRRMWLLGTTFIIASGFVYFLFLTAWLNLFLLLGFIVFIRIGIGIVALGVGVYQLRDFFTNKEGECKVVKSERRSQIFDRIRRVVNEKQLLLALGGMVVLAGAVNAVELVCSAGLPAIYTNILSLSNLATWQYYLYLLLYMLIFMLDDLIIFFLAMTTFKIAGVQGKYARFSHLVGGIVIAILGAVMLFKPEWLMFG